MVSPKRNTTPRSVATGPRKQLPWSMPHEPRRSSWLLLPRRPLPGPPCCKTLGPTPKPQPHGCLIQDKLSQAVQPSRMHRFLLPRAPDVLPPEKSSLTAMNCQSGGRTALPGDVPATNKAGSSPGSHTQSTTHSAKWAASGQTSCQHGADSQRGISIEADPLCSLNVLQTFPTKL